MANTFHAGPYSPTTFVPDTVYIQFQANIHDSADVSSVLQMGISASQGEGGGFYVYWDTNLSIRRVIGVGVGAGKVSINSQEETDLDEWYTIEIAARVLGRSTLIIEAAENGIPLEPDSDTQGNFQNWLFSRIENLFIGGINPGDTLINHHLKDIKIGTRGFGSSDLFSFDHTVDKLSKFDSITGSGISIDADGILVQNSGTEVYATKAITFPPAYAD